MDQLDGAQPGRAGAHAGAVRILPVLDALHRVYRSFGHGDPAGDGGVSGVPDHHGGDAHGGHPVHLDCDDCGGVRIAGDPVPAQAPVAVYWMADHLHSGVSGLLVLPAHLLVLAHGRLFVGQHAYRCGREGQQEDCGGHGRRAVRRHDDPGEAVQRVPARGVGGGCGAFGALGHDGRQRTVWQLAGDPAQRTAEPVQGRERVRGQCGGIGVRPAVGRRRLLPEHQRAGAAGALATGVRSGAVADGRHGRHGRRRIAGVYGHAEHVRHAGHGLDVRHAELVGVDVRHACHGEPDGVDVRHAADDAQSADHDAFSGGVGHWLDHAPLATKHWQQHLGAAAPAAAAAAAAAAVAAAAAGCATGFDVLDTERGESVCGGARAASACGERGVGPDGRGDPGGGADVSGVAGESDERDQAVGARGARGGVPQRRAVVQEADDQQGHRRHALGWCAGLSLYLSHTLAHTRSLCKGSAHALFVFFLVFTFCDCFINARTLLFSIWLWNRCVG
ncbi:hypothetical protein L1887_55324 [Cichorium endivia]|nr:hypothetical protein L1887_55324 [Cichorium endivia]